MQNRISESSNQKNRTQALVSLMFFTTLLLNAAQVVLSTVDILTHTFEESANCKPSSIGIDDFLPVGQSEKRLAGLKKWCVGKSPIGYICDGETVITSHGEMLVDDRSLGKFILTQYALVPSLVFHENMVTSHETVRPQYVIVDLYKTDLQTFLKQRDYYPKDYLPFKDFGNGVFVCRRPGEK